MGITETHHPATDYARATTALSGSGGKNVDWEKSQLSMSQVATLCYAPIRARVGSDRGRTGTRHGDGLGFSGEVHCADSAFASCISITGGPHGRRWT